MPVEEDSPLGEMSLKWLPRRPLSPQARAWMLENDYDPHMQCFRAVTSGAVMLKLKAARPDVENILWILTGPYGVVDARPKMEPMRIVELQVDDNIIDVEKEYEE